MKTISLEYDENNPKCIKILALLIASEKATVLDGMNELLIQAIEGLKSTNKVFKTYEDIEEVFNEILAE